MKLFFYWISASLKPNSKIFSEKKFFSDLSYQESVLEGIRLKLVWCVSNKGKSGDLGKEKESNYSVNNINKDKDTEKGKAEEGEEFLPSYLAMLPTIIGPDICDNCKGTRFAGPFLVCGKCNGEKMISNK